MKNATTPQDRISYQKRPDVSGKFKLFIQTILVTRRIYLAGLFFLMLHSLQVSALNDALKVKVTGNGYSDEAVTRFLNGATTHFDGNYDAYKLFSGNPNVPTAYSMADSFKLSINAYPELNRDYSIALAIEVGVTGTYNLEAIELGAFSTRTIILLEDLITGSIVPFRHGAIYSCFVNSNPINTDPRFILHFIASQTSIAFDVSCNGEIDGKICASKLTANPWNYLWMNANGDTLKSTENVYMGDTLTGLAAGTYYVITSKPNICSSTDTIIVNEPAAILAGFTTNMDTTAMTPSGAAIQFSNISTGATSYSWSFGDGSSLDTTLNPAHIYYSQGQFNTILSASKGICSDTVSKTITILGPYTGNKYNLPNQKTLQVYPTVTSGTVYVEFNSLNDDAANISIYTLSGQKVFGSTVEMDSYHKTRLDISDLSTGTYIIYVETGLERYIQKVFKN